MNNKEKKHIERLNEEVGSIDVRLSKMEGKIGEGFEDMKSDIKALFEKIDMFPCNIHSERIVKLETRMKDMLKTRYIAFGAIVGLLVWLVQYILIH